MAPQKRAADAAADQELVLKANMVGPDGTTRTARSVVPDEWLTSKDFDAEQLVSSGGAHYRKRKG